MVLCTALFLLGHQFFVRTPQETGRCCGIKKHRALSEKLQSCDPPQPSRLFVPFLTVVESSWQLDDTGNTIVGKFWSWSTNVGKSIIILVQGRCKREHGSVSHEEAASYLCCGRLRPRPTREPFRKNAAHQLFLESYALEPSPKDMWLVVDPVQV
ncbi:hypothetical protein EAF04_008931 [Stromatinia cepivora]|nr:hypothetical protein EAF04_008931 [Stromatinia cepivora]